MIAPSERVVRCRRQRYGDGQVLNRMCVIREGLSLRRCERSISTTCLGTAGCSRFRSTDVESVVVCGSGFAWLVFGASHPGLLCDGDTVIAGVGFRLPRGRLLV